MTDNKKNRSNKKKATTPKSALGELMKKLALTPSTSSEMTCYHGSPAEKFYIDNDYEKSIRDYLLTQLKFSKGHSSAIWEKNNMLNVELGMKFDLDHLEFMKDLKLEGNVSAKSVVQALLIMGFRIKYRWIPVLLPGVLAEKCSTKKLKKYCRDIRTDDRTIINILSRETKAFCDCMKPKKTEAKNTKKMGRCSGCDTLFPKEQMLECTRCRSHYYHSKEYQINHWPFHKFFCKERVSIAERNGVFRSLVSCFGQKELEETK
jgi:hypothetical protein